MNEIDYTIGLPTEPPEDMISFLKKQGAFEGEYLVYKSGYTYNPLTDRRERAAEVICTDCGETFYQEYISVQNECSWRSGTDIGFINSETREEIFGGNCTFCPSCGAEVCAIHTSRISRYGIELNKVFPITVEVIQGRLVIMSWYIRRLLYKDGREEFSKVPYEAYILDGRKMIKLCGYQSSMFNRSYVGKWCLRKKCTDTFGSHYGGYTYPFDPKILIGTDAENSKLDVYLNSEGMTYPITYLRIWQRHRNAENLVMQGASHIISERIKSLNSCGSTYSSNITGIDWKKKRPHEMLGLTKAEFKRVVWEWWLFRDIEFYKTAKKYGVGPEDMPKCRNVGFYEIKKLFDVDNNVIKSLEYLEKQKKKYPKNKNECTPSTLADYWNMAMQNGEDLSQHDIKYPQNLVRAHNTVLMQMKFKEDEKLREKFVQRYSELEKYSYSLDGIMIRPARDENELIREGKVLKHCVATYAKRHANGETAIFFIRNTSDAEIPFYTLEFDEKKLRVRQNRGKSNCARTAEVKGFEEKWLEWLKNMRGENEDGKHNNEERRTT